MRIQELIQEQGTIGTTGSMPANNPVAATNQTAARPAVPTAVTPSAKTMDPNTKQLSDLLTKEKVIDTPTDADQVIATLQGLKQNPNTPVDPTVTSKIGTATLNNPNVAQQLAQLMAKLPKDPPRPGAATAPAATPPPV